MKMLKIVGFFGGNSQIVGLILRKSTFFGENT